MYIYIFIYKYWFIYIYVYMNINICIYLCIYKYTYMFIYRWDSEVAERKGWKKETYGAKQGIYFENRRFSMVNLV
jgi:hypothetical protein